MLENLVNNIIPIRWLFDLSFTLINLYLILILLIWYIIIKLIKFNLNYYLITIIFIILILLSFKINVYSFYYLPFYTLTFLFIWHFIWIFKLSNGINNLWLNINYKQLSKKYDLFFILFLVLYIFIYLSINETNFDNIIEADSWLHLTKILKYNYESQNFSPIFLWEFHHYPEFTYFVVKYIWDFLWLVDFKVFYWLSWLILWCISYLLYYILINNFTKNKIVSLFSLSFIIWFNSAVIPNSFLLFLFLIFLFILYKLLLHKNNINLKLFILINIFISIIFTHYFWAVLIWIFIFTFLFLSLFFHYYESINDKLSEVFIKSYLLFISNIKLSINLLIIILIIVINAYFTIWSDKVFWFYSEIWLSFNNVLTFLIIWLIIPTIWLINIIYKSNKYLLIYFYSIIIFFTNIIFYYSWLFKFHWRYFPEYSLRFVLWPFVFLLLYIIYKKSSKKYIFIIILLYLISFNIVQYKYLSHYVKWSNNFRHSYTNELLKYKSDLSWKVIFINPYSYLNRFIVVDLNSYIYSVNYKNKWTIPFSTIPNKIDSYNYSHPWDRYNLATEFINNQTIENYKNLFKYKIDYFILEKKVDNNLIEYFNAKKDKLEIIETNNYIIIKV